MVPDVRKVASLKRWARRYLFYQTDEKWHGAVARSAFSSQNAQNTTRSDQFSKVRCPKMARRCGAKHIFKSKCTKHHTVGPVFEGQMSKNRTPLWREVCKSKNEKTDGYGPLFGLQMWKIARRCGAKRICKSKCTKHLRFAAF